MSVPVSLLVPGWLVVGAIGDNGFGNPGDREKVLSALDDLEDSE